MRFQARTTEHFTMVTAIGAAIQTLEAIEELHSIGYLHRDIKPGNYSVGLPERRGELRRIFILDFGMCRRYVRNDNITLRRPRAAAGFRGTPRYAALRCHMVGGNGILKILSHSIHSISCRTWSIAARMTSSPGST